MDPSSPPSLPHDLGSPETFLPGRPLWQWLVLALIILLVLVALTVLVVHFYRRLRSTAPAEEDPYERSRKQLKEVDPTQDLAEVATACSLALRDCFGQVLQEPLLFETGQELRQRWDAFQRAPKSIRPQMIALLEDLEESKYSPSRQNEDQAKEWIERSQFTLTELHRELTTRVQETSSH